MATFADLDIWYERVTGESLRSKPAEPHEDDLWVAIDPGGGSYSLVSTGDSITFTTTTTFG
jgi:hypothetical protein